MKRSILIVLIFMAILSVSAGAVYRGKPPVKEENWNNLPRAWKFNFTTFGEYGARSYDQAEFQIAGFVLTKESAEKFYSKDWADVKSNFLRTIKNYPDRIILMVYVYSYGNSMESFDPEDFFFSRHGSPEESEKYRINSEADILSLTDNFKENRLEDEVAVGIIAVPKGINKGETFYIHYRDGKEKAYRESYFTEDLFEDVESNENQGETYFKEQDENTEKEDQIEISSVGKLRKVTIKKQISEVNSNSKEVRNISGSTDSNIVVSSRKKGYSRFYKCSGFINFEAGKLIDRSYHFSEIPCEYNGNGIALTKATMDLNINLEPDQITITVTEGGQSKTYLYKGNVMILDE